MVNIKVHAAIISVIVLAIYVVWANFIYKEPLAPKTVVVSAYQIQISRASYGLDCLEYFSQGLEPASGSSAYDVERYKKKLRTNNVLTEISKRCNGKPKCEIKVDPDTLGFKGFPTCGIEDLKLEFRCFAVDNLRKATHRSGTVAVIDCDKFVMDDK